MTLVFELAIRSAVLIAVGLAFAALLRRQPAALRHAVLAMTIVAATAVMPLSAIVPSWHLSLPSFASQATLAEPSAEATIHLAVTATSADASGFPVLALARLVWIAGVVACAAVLLVGFARLARIARRARVVHDAEWVRVADELRAAYGIRRPVTILQTDAADLLATFGMRRPRVLLPAHAPGWTPDRIRAVLAHELAHVSRHDWLVQMGAEALRCLYWFNPLMWIACARLRSESEYACDDAVLGRGMAPRDYAAHLVELARVCRRPRRHAPLAAMPMARPSTLERRITAMLNPNLNRASVSWRASAAAAALLIALSWSVAAARTGDGAQSSPATLTGVIYDSSGSVLPGVALTLQDAEQRTLTATSTGGGRFEFPSVAPGKYVLEAKLAGFRTFRQDIALSSARDWDRAITLQVGELRETIMVQASRVAPTGPSQPQPTRLKVGGNIRVPRKLHDVKPVYPVSMREAGREGVVPLEATIGTEGTVTSVRFLTADVHPDFAIAAADAVRQWRFDPTLLNGAPVEVRMTVSVEFKLSN